MVTDTFILRMVTDTFALRMVPDTFAFSKSCITLPAMKEEKRCFWVTEDPLYLRYHDEEWGNPVHDELRWFEFITLEGAQAGLSWITVLRKRENYRKALAGFDPKKIARFGAAEKKCLLANEGIIRNRLKIDSTITNAQAFLELQKQEGSFDKFIWDFVGGKPIKNRPKGRGDIPSSTELSDALSWELKKRGFRFVGSTILYAMMQACGLVWDHTRDCYRSTEVQ